MKWSDGPGTGSASSYIPLMLIQSPGACSLSSSFSKYLKIQIPAWTKNSVLTSESYELGLLRKHTPGLVYYQLQINSLMSRLGIVAVTTTSTTANTVFSSQIMLNSVSTTKINK